MLGHKASRCKFKKIKIISFFLSQSSAIRNKSQENTLKNINTWQLNNMLLRNHWITEKLKEEIKKKKKNLETNEKESTTVQNLWDAAKAVLSGKFMAIYS